MRYRPPVTYLLLAALFWGAHPVQVTAHAQEHADPEASHAHQSGQIPHHEHEPDNKPIPAGQDDWALVGRAAGSSAVFQSLWVVTGPPAIITPTHLLPSITLVFRNLQDTRLLEALDLSPGKTLPLLI